MRTLFYLLLLGASLTSCIHKYYVVRHADRPIDDSDALTDLGLTRAKVLADTLAKKNIKNIFVTATNRSRLTANPLSARIGIPLTEYAEPLDAFTMHLKTRKNSLVVGHSNTILEIVQKLGAEPSVSRIGDREFDRLFIVTRRKRLFRLPLVLLYETRYGATAH